MSNLGAYQAMTTLAKKVGGPVKLAILVAAGGYGVIRGGEAGVKAIVKGIKKHNEKKTTDNKIYVVKKEGISNEGLSFNEGDKFRVLEIVEDAILIEKIGDTNNPYFVDVNLLRSISDYK